MGNPYLNYLIMGVGVAALLFAIREIINHRHPKPLEGEVGRLEVNAHIIAAIGITGVSFAVAALSSAISGSGGIAAWTVGLTAFVLGVVSLASLRPGYDVSWDEDGLEGPITLFVPLRPPKRAKIYWEDLETVGRDQQGNWYVQDAGGQRIRWNYLYSGYPTLMSLVEEECPWLFDESLDGRRQSLQPAN